MIERQIVESNVKELKIQEYITSALKNLGQSHIKLQRTPLGEKIIIYASRPGLIVGRKGQNIKKLTEDLKANFKLDNPQIEINEVENPNLDAQIVAERIASSLEKFGTQRFKGIGHRVMSDVMGSGALGIEILISGKIPSSRSKRWRFYQGYLKKCGDIAIVGVRKAYAAAQIKTGTVGIQVRIMPPDVKLPDYVKIEEGPSEIIEELKESIKQKGKPKKTEKTEKAEKDEKNKAEKPKKRLTKKEEKEEKKEEEKEEEKSEAAEKEENVKTEEPAEAAQADTEDFGEETPVEESKEDAKEDAKEEAKEESPAPEAEKTE